MKNSIIFIFGVFLFTLINSNAISASTDLLVEEDYIQRDPITNKYSRDWSFLDTPENLQLQKDVQNHFSKKLTMRIQSEHLEYEDDLNERIINLLNQIDPGFADSYYEEVDSYFKESNLISPMGSYDLPGIDKVLVKLLEAKLHLSVGKLTTSNIATVLENSNSARDHGIRYAKNNNFYNSAGELITWDNTADTLRHFAWNYMNANDLGDSKAKTVGDIHEVALVALDIMNNDIDNAKLCKY